MNSLGEVFRRKSGAFRRKSSSDIQKCTKLLSTDMFQSTSISVDETDPGSNLGWGYYHCDTSIIIITTACTVTRVSVQGSWRPRARRPGGAASPTSRRLLVTRSAARPARQPPPALATPRAAPPRPPWPGRGSCPLG